MSGMNVSEIISERLGQPPSGTDRARALFQRAMQLFRARAYRDAIVLFERVRHMPGVPKPERLLYDIGLANLKLRRFATAIIYFENFLATAGLSASDQADGQRRLREAKQGAGIP